MTEDEVVAEAMRAAKEWRMSNGIRDDSGGMSTTGSYRAAIIAAFEAGKRECGNASS